jgi:phosphoglycolate phosphatase-like HAD superfamily hydrolase
MKLFVWDLHGTLETGNDRAVVDISNHTLAQAGHPQRFSYADGRTLYGRRWREYFTWLLRDHTHTEALRLEDACFALSETGPACQTTHLKPAPHTHQVLTAVAAAGHEQVVISNTRPVNLDLFLKTLGLEGFFPAGRAFATDHTPAGPAVTKTDVLRGYLTASPARFERLVIVGDSPADMALKQVAGGVTYLYTQPGFEVRDAVADHRIRDLREVLTEL